MFGYREAATLLHAESVCNVIQALIWCVCAAHASVACSSLTGVWRVGTHVSSLVVEKACKYVYIHSFTTDVPVSLLRLVIKGPLPPTCPGVYGLGHM